MTDLFLVINTGKTLEYFMLLPKDISYVKVNKSYLHSVEYLDYLINIHKLLFIPRIVLGQKIAGCSETPGELS